jgi:tetratricopeptide (TPR) repeat protein
MHERNCQRQTPGPRAGWGRPSRLALAALPIVWALGTTGCIGLSFPDEPAPEADQTRDATAEPEPPPALVAAREMEATRQTWSSLAAEARGAIKLGDFEAAEQAYLAAVSLTAELEPDDIRASTSLSNLARLAGLYQRRRQFEDAGRVIDQLVAESLIGRHADFGVIAPIMLAQGAYLEREQRLSEAIRIFEAGLASAPRSSIGSRERMLMQRGLALAYIEAGRPDEAEPLLEDLLARTDRVGDGRAGSHAAMLIDMGRLREAQDDLAAADLSYQQAIDLYRETEPENAMLARVLNRQASLWIRTERSKEAIPLAEEALKIVDDLGAIGPSRATFLDTLATARANIEHNSQAEANYKQALEARSMGDARSKASQVEFVEHYAAFLRKLGREADAAALDAQLDAERAEAEEAKRAEAAAAEQAQAESPAPSEGAPEAAAEVAVAPEPGDAEPEADEAIRPERDAN